MIVLEIIKPGHFIKENNKCVSPSIDLMLDNLIDSFIEANQALNIFDSAYEVDMRSKFEQFKTNLDLQSEFLKKHQTSKGLDDYIKNREKYALQATSDVIKFNLKNDIEPRIFRDKTMFISAKAFIFSLDNFNNLLKETISVCTDKELESNLNALKLEFDQFFPTLRHIRNSAHHIEERVQIRANKKPITLKPADNEMIKSNCGVLELGSLSDRIYSITGQNGGIERIEISLASLQFVQQLLKKILEQFEWEQDMVHYPGM